LDDSSNGGLNDTFVGLQIGKQERNRLPGTSQKRHWKISERKREDLLSRKAIHLYQKKAYMNARKIGLNQAKAMLPKSQSERFNELNHESTSL
jgi:hypothetical protein